MLVRLPAACRRWWPSPALQALPYLLHPPRPAPADPQRGGGSRRSLLLPRERAGRRERSASPPVWAPPWAARLAGCASPLVHHHYDCAGYRRASFCRASAAVNRQSTVAPRSLRSLSHAATSPASIYWSGMRCPERHWRESTESSTSTWLSHEPCLGVW